MSDALKKLEEIEARLAELRAAPLPLPETLVNRWEAHAPGDMALLARLVRSVAESGCVRTSGIESCRNYNWSDPRKWDLYGCWPCRVRRELEAAR